MKNNFYPVIRLILVLASIWLGSVPILQGQVCAPVSSLTAVTTTTHITLSWTNPRTASFVKVTYVTDNITRNYTSFSTQTIILRDPNAAYEYTLVTAHYPDGCVSAIEVWSPDIVVTIDDIYKYVDENCDPGHGNPYILIEDLGDIEPIQLNNLCCLATFVQNQAYEPSEISIQYVNHLLYYIGEGTIFPTNFCEYLNNPGFNGGSGGQNKREAANLANEICEIYPNPCRQYLRLRIMQSQAQAVEVKLYNAVGQEVAVWLQGERLESGLHEQQYAVGHLKMGIYFLQYQSPDRVIRKKVLIQH